MTFDKNDAYINISSNIQKLFENMFRLIHTTQWNQVSC